MISSVSLILSHLKFVAKCSLYPYTAEITWHVISSHGNNERDCKVNKTKKHTQSVQNCFFFIVKYANLWRSCHRRVRGSSVKLTCQWFIWNVALYNYIKHSLNHQCFSENLFSFFSALFVLLCFFFFSIKRWRHRLHFFQLHFRQEVCQPHMSSSIQPLILVTSFR